MTTASQRIVVDALELLDADGQTILRFAAAGPTGLLGAWLVTAVADESGALVATDAASPMTATFGSSGTPHRRDRLRRLPRRLQHARCGPDHGPPPDRLGIVRG